MSGFNMIGKINRAEISRGDVYQIGVINKVGRRVLGEHQLLIIHQEDDVAEIVGVISSKRPQLQHITGYQLGDRLQFNSANAFVDNSVIPKVIAVFPLRGSAAYSCKPFAGHRVGVALVTKTAAYRL